jgi:hypothetical protein
MKTSDSPFRDARSPDGNMARPEFSGERFHYDLQRAIVSALAKSVRKFRKHPRFSPAWCEALRNLQHRDPREYQNGLDFVDQLLKEFIKALRRALKDPVALGRLFPLVASEGRSFCAVEEDLRRLACCSGQDGAGIDPAWDAVYEQILLRPAESGRPRPITRSFDELLQLRDLNLRREITDFLQREFPTQFATVVKTGKNRPACLAKFIDAICRNVRLLLRVESPDSASAKPGSN